MSDSRTLNGWHYGELIGRAIQAGAATSAKLSVANPM
ncbi:hypothetical protein FHS20_003678 [Phyllobacterium endophyticum]|nr:hypothetical protein [Phyllobacterium endophyticum]